LAAARSVRDEWPGKAKKLLKKALSDDHSVSSTAQWSKGVFQGDLSFPFTGGKFKANIYSEPNITHDRTIFVSKASSDGGKELFRSEGGESHPKLDHESTEAEMRITGPELFGTPSGMTASFRSDPVEPTSKHVRSNAGMWGMDALIGAKLDGTFKDGGEAAGKLGVVVKSPQKEPATWDVDLADPFPWQ